MSKNNGLRTWLLAALFAIVMAACGYIVRSTAGDIDKLQVKDTTQDERMDTMDVRLTEQLYKFRVSISDNNAEQKKEATRSQLMDSLILDKLGKIESRLPR